MLRLLLRSNAALCYFSVFLLVFFRHFLSLFILVYFIFHTNLANRITRTHNAHTHTSSSNKKSAMGKKTKMRKSQKGCVRVCYCIYWFSCWLYFLFIWFASSSVTCNISFCFPGYAIIYSILWLFHDFIVFFPSFFLCVFVCSPVVHLYGLVT